MKMFATRLAATMFCAVSFFTPQAKAYDTAQSHSEFPWQVSLWHAQLGGHFCGAVLVAPNWALGVANCFRDGNNAPYHANLDEVTVIIGATDLTEGGERFGIEQLIVHPGYDPANQRNNIALLKLSGSTTLGRAIDLPESGRAVGDGELLRIAGWGITAVGDSMEINGEMKVVTLPAVAKAVCNAPEGYGGAVTDDQLCAGFIEGGEDACQGFSGSAAIHVTDAVPALAGLAAWGYGCGTPKKVGVYTRASSFTDWIRDTIAAN